MSDGGRPHLPLTSEPMPFLRTHVIGGPVPGPVQPVEHRLALEEEPALRVHLSAPASAAGPAPPAHTAPPPSRDRRALPATGASLPLPVAAGAIGLAWLLRQRRSDVG